MADMTGQKNEIRQLGMTDSERAEEIADSRRERPRTFWTHYFASSILVSFAVGIFTSVM
jgi:hypothetical protein